MMLLGRIGFIIAVPVALTAALLGIGAADAGLTAFFTFVEIVHDTADDRGKNENQKKCFHNYLPSAYSALSWVLVLTIKPAITAAITATAIRPGRKPAPNAPVVNSVPNWYTRNATI